MLKASAAKDFVERLVEDGYEVCAIGKFYVLADPEEAQASAKLHDFLRGFGPRDHLTADIAAYLHRIGRYIPVETID
ncbi:hypothetical protein [Rhizobium hidalgonense]|uniref:hypothetical protein n=1 Tax=Rhizobium hidalgonense TaxID=1538159 RepID=UPI00110668C7|nr:hypothetical protein [Rhizobium hidalgonense]QKK26955.1 hypothetical protein FFM81_027190 [Rhizobium hidalgonense]